MAYTLKLTIYCISLRKKRKKEFSQYKDFFKEAFSSPEEQVNKQSLFSRFINKFEQSFDDKFVLNYDMTKGIAINSINAISALNIVDGMIIGGLTGVEQDVYDSSKATEKEDTIEKDKVTALPYYFKLWMPFDSSMGILMVQSYTEVGVTSLLSNKIKSFFGQFDYMIDLEKFVPTEYKEKFKKSSYVEKLTLYKNRLSEDARSSLNKLFTGFEGLKIQIEVTGFKVDIDDFWKNVDREEALNADLSDFEMENDNYDVIATYKDPEGRQSQARLSKNLDILPTIILDNDLKEDGKEYPNYERIQQHTNTILGKVKIEIEYAPEAME